jgi:hypothetical protein
MAKIEKEELLAIVAKAFKSLNTLPSTYMGVSKLGEKLRKCKKGTKNFRKYEKALFETENLGLELSLDIRDALKDIKLYLEQ